MLIPHLLKESRPVYTDLTFRYNGRVTSRSIINEDGL